MSLANMLQTIEFIKETDALKSVYRKTSCLKEERFENSAEHSWQLALLVMTMQPHIDVEFDVLKTIKMLLIHDIVEIDSGDQFAYSSTHNNFDNEFKAAQRIFALLPAPLNDELLNLWVEFENSETTEAKIGKALDRMMPMLLNLWQPEKSSWLEYGISAQQVREKNAIVGEVMPELWQELMNEVQRQLPEL